MCIISNIQKHSIIISCIWPFLFKLKKFWLTTTCMSKVTHSVPVFLHEILSIDWELFSQRMSQDPSPPIRLTAKPQDEWLSRARFAGHLETMNETDSVSRISWNKLQWRDDHQDDEFYWAVYIFIVFVYFFYTFTFSNFFCMLVTFYLHYFSCGSLGDDAVTDNPEYDFQFEKI